MLNYFEENNTFFPLLVSFHVSMSPSECQYGRRDSGPHSFPVTQNWVRMFSHFLALTNLHNISKVKAVSFLLGLILMFIMMSSYILGWDKRGPLLPHPHRLRSDATSTNVTSVEVCSQEDLLDMTCALKLIDSRLEYAPRKVPDIKEITAAAPRVSLWSTFGCCVHSSSSNLNRGNRRTWREPTQTACRETWDLLAMK